MSILIKSWRSLVKRDDALMSLHTNHDLGTRAAQIRQCILHGPLVQTMSKIDQLCNELGLYIQEGGNDVDEILTQLMFNYCHCNMCKILFHDLCITENEKPTFLLLKKLKPCHCGGFCNVWMEMLCLFKKFY